jgi:hypothetical protein
MHADLFMFAASTWFPVFSGALAHQAPSLGHSNMQDAGVTLYLKLQEVRVAERANALLHTPDLARPKQTQGVLV